MTTQFWLIQAFNGLSYGALLFLLASGLSLIFGVMRIVNLAHGSYFLLGGYIGLSVIWRPDRGRSRSRWRRYRSRPGPGDGADLPAPAGTDRSAGADDDRLRVDLPGSRPGDLGRRLLRHRPARALAESVLVGGLFFRSIGSSSWAGLAIGLVLWLALERTRVGAMIRASVDDAEMAGGVGIDGSLVSMRVFALGAFLAALGGVIGGAFLGVYPGPRLRDAAACVRGRHRRRAGQPAGAMVGSLLVGLLDNFGKALFPELSYFTLFAPMALILALKPTGLFGRE